MKYITINNRKVSFDDEKNLLTVIRKAGIDLPTFCYHSELSSSYVPLAVFPIISSEEAKDYVKQAKEVKKRIKNEYLQLVESKLLSEEEYERFINDSTIPYRVTRDLEHAREEDLDRYHETISEVAHELLAEYIKRKKEGASQ